MKNYTVFFKVFEKKFKTTVLAASKNAAEIVAKNRIARNVSIIKVEEANEIDNKNILNFLTGFKS